MYLDNLKKQHIEIYELFKELTSYKIATQVVDHADSITDNLTKLAGIAMTHFAAEDNYLYPELSKSNNAHVKFTADKFYREIAGLSTIFNDFRTKFMTPSKLKANPEAFLVESKDVISKLTDRLKKEELELFPLVKE